MSRATEKDIAMTRKRDERIDKKIGSMIRMQRLKLGMSQSDLATCLAVFAEFAIELSS